MPSSFVLLASIPVAVTGLPEPQSNHAVIMVRFAGECMMRMNEVTKELEVSLGPDTGDLGMRFGLHSGPVTAGVLRGDRARFQLFGDTVNTAARMESTGTKNRIQCSQATADLLLAAGKKHWVRAREDSVEAKGKGVLNTFWLHPMSKNDSSATSSDNDGALVSLDGDSANPTGSRMGNDANDKKKDRLVDWMVEILLFDIRKIVSSYQTITPRTCWLPLARCAPIDRNSTNNFDLVSYRGPFYFPSDFCTPSKSKFKTTKQGFWRRNIHSTRRCHLS